MTVEDAKEVTEVVKGKLKENGDVYSEHILAYVSYLEAQIEKMKCCGNCFNSLYGNRGENGRCEDCGNKDNWELKK